MNCEKEDKKRKSSSQIILLDDLYRKFDRQTADNVSFDSKMGILLGFFALYFIEILTQIMGSPHLLSSALFFIGAVTGFIAVLVLIAAFYPTEYKDPGKIKSFYKDENFEKDQKEIRKNVIEAHKEAYEANAQKLNFKAKLCKAGLSAFTISIISLFIFIINANMILSQYFGFDNDLSSRTGSVAMGDGAGLNGGEGNCDVKTLSEE